MWHATLVLGLILAAPQAPAGAAPDAVAKARAAVAHWVATPAELNARAAAARAVAASGRPAVQELAERLAAVGPSGRAAEQKALADLVPAVGVEVLRRELATGFVFAGQYDELRPLLPCVGDYFLGLVMAPPDWLPRVDRAMLLPVLRDLYEESPGPEVLARLRGLAAEVPADENLGFRIACALAQWGEPDLVDARRRELEGRGKGSLADRLAAQERLGMLYYELRDMGRAADVLVACVKEADERQHAMRPGVYYNACCVLCLAGRQTEALSLLERCLEVQRSTHRSERLQRSMFEQDPELAAIRNTERFRELMRRAAAY